ncbi:MAG: type II toxin-antitoxin system VapC family toxin [Bryobacteraceae bacterium]|nr:type II toxin-antitoxin system VapC family toxin [Bryobacteraceae bacterium]
MGQRARNRPVLPGLSRKTPERCPAAYAAGYPAFAPVAEPGETLFLSVVNVGELGKRCTIMPDGKRRAQLETWMETDLLPLFYGRTLPVTLPIADRWGMLEGLRRLAGRPLGAPDGMIAATAIEHRLTVVTRNLKDFEGLGVNIINPWDE